MSVLEFSECVLQHQILLLSCLISDKFSDQLKFFRLFVVVYRLSIDSDIQSSLLFICLDTAVN